MTKKRTAASAPALTLLNRIKTDQAAEAAEADGPPTTFDQVDRMLEAEGDLDLGPSPVEDLEQAPPRTAAAVSSPPANRLTAAEAKPVVDGALTRCKNCGSTDRTGYANRRELRHEGTTPDGLPYNLVVWRDTRCAACLQLRCDRHYEQTSGQV